MKLSCCAADAYSVKVTPVGGSRLPTDTWVAVTGTWEPSREPRSPNDFVPPRIKVESLEQVAEPEIPYEWRGARSRRPSTLTSSSTAPATSSAPAAPSAPFDQSTAASVTDSVRAITPSPR